MTEDARIVYFPHPDLTPEQEKAVLASVYRFLLERDATRTTAPRRGHPRLGGVDGTWKKEPSGHVDSSPMEEPKFGVPK
jgi:hypothetical protein